MIPLILSAYTHLWNIDGFPSIYRDEDHYMRKAMHVLRGLGPQEGPTELLSYPQTTYTHPYFGQLFLASVLGSWVIWLSRLTKPNNHFQFNQRSVYDSTAANGIARNT